MKRGEEVHITWGDIKDMDDWNDADCDDIPPVQEENPYLVRDFNPKDAWIPLARTYCQDEDRFADVRWFPMGCILNIKSRLTGTEYENGGVKWLDPLADSDIQH